MNYSFRILFIFILILLKNVSFADTKIINVEPKPRSSQIEKLINNAHNGDANAQFILGKKYFFGIDLDKDISEGIKWLTLAAQKDNEGAQIVLGLIYLRANHIKEAEHWFRLAAAHENPKIQIIFSSFLIKIKGPDGYDEGIELLKKVAKKNDSEAQKNLGMYYWAGVGVPRNYVESEKWLRLSSEQGNVDAQLGLGMLLASDHTKLVEAYKWLLIASSTGSKEAQQEMEKVYKKLTMEEIDKAQHDAKVWHEKHTKKTRHSTK